MKAAARASAAATKYGARPMRRLVFTALSAILVSATIGSFSPASAARYCLQGAGWGYPGNCQFRTFAQCRASASGTNAGCGINPRYAYRSGARTYRGGTVGMGSGAQYGAYYGVSGTVGAGGSYGPRGGLVGGSDNGVSGWTR